MPNLLPSFLRNYSWIQGFVRSFVAASLFWIGALPLFASIGIQPQQFQQPNVIATGSWPASIESADLNGDGRPDLVYTDFGATATAASTHIQLNNGDGTFVSGQTIATAGASVVVADFDRDGHPDLEWVWSKLGEGRVYFARGNGDGTFAAPVMLGTFAQIGTNVPQLNYLAAAAMHPSGYLDLLVEDSANSALFELTADASGVLVRLYAIHLPHEAGPMFTADLNGDGNTDVVIQSSAIDVFWGNADGILSAATTYGGVSGVRSMLLEDVDSDGHPDILVEGTAGHLDILHGSPDGSFSTISSGGTGSLDPATGAGGRLIGLTAGRNLYTSTAAGIGVLGVQADLSMRLEGLYNAGPSPAQGQSSFVLADFNGDGIPDVAIDSPEGIAILYGNADGSLQSSRSFSSNRPALNSTLGAFTASGSLDALVTLAPAQPQLMHGNGDGTFSVTSTPGPGLSATANGPTLTVDLNNDSVLDLILSTTSGLLLELGNGDGTFGAPSVISSSGSHAIATNISARAAIATSDTAGEHILMGPALTPTTLAMGTPGLVAAGDVNRDGTNDLLYQSGATWTVYLDRSGSFSPVSALPGVPTQPNLNAAAVVITDLDGDGNGDVLILFDNTSADHAHPSASVANQLLAWYGNGDGTFAAPVAIPVARNYTQLVATEIQNNGVPDLVLSDGYVVGILRNLGARNFGPEQHLLAGGSISSISTADLNGDGTNDLVLSNGSSVPNAEVSTGGITVLLNKLTPKTALVQTTISLVLTTPTSITYGQVVDGYAQVQSADNSALSGTITFYDGTVSICSIPVTTSVSCPASSGSGFAAGQHTLTATYSGDATHGASTSTPVVVTVQSAGTTATVSSSLNPAAAGEAVTFSAVLASSYATPSGAVDFYDSGALIGSAILDATGKATFTTSTLSAGTHSISVSFAGSSNFKSSVSSAISQVITSVGSMGPTATMVSSSANPSTSGQSITLTANVVGTSSSKNAAPTGTVTFYDGAASLGNTALNSNGLATITTSSLAVGSHAITAVYVGDANFVSSTSTAFTQTVSALTLPSATSFIITPASNAITVETGNSANILVKVSPVNGFNQPVSLTCSNLPDSSTCAFAAATIPAGGATTTLKLTTSAPRACGSPTSYAQSGGQTASLDSKAALPFAAPALAGMVFWLVPKRRALRSVVTLIALCGTFMALTGCGACTDLGTRPGSYTFTITGTSTGSSAMTVNQTIKVTVTE
jgi:hypothetical protein